MTDLCHFLPLTFYFPLTSKNKTKKQNGRKAAPTDVSNENDKTSEVDENEDECRDEKKRNNLENKEEMRL